MGVRRGRQAPVIVLAEDEREALERWARRPTSTQALALRCRIVLAAASGLSNSEIAGQLGCVPATVGKWRTRFAQSGLDGLSDEPRPGPPRTVSNAAVEDVIVKTLASTPQDAPHWSTRSMARETGLSQTTVSRIWRALGLRPQAAADSKASSDPQFVDQVREVVDLDNGRWQGASGSVVASGDWPALKAASGIEAPRSDAR